MNELESESIDLIVTAPPYNIGTVYGTHPDIQTFDEYREMLSNVWSECARVLKAGEAMIVECADTVLSDGTYVSLAALMQKILIEQRLCLVERHINFNLTEKGVEQPEHGWSDDFRAKGPAHSNLHQILVFRKAVTPAFDESTGKILYYMYPSNEDGHPCPFPSKFISFVLDRYFHVGMHVLDPFAGVGRLGCEVLRRGGVYFGYEIEERHCKTATSNLRNVNT